MLKTMTVRTTIAAIFAGLSLSAHAIADPARRINVPAGELVAALETLSRQAAVDLVFQPDQLRSFRTDGVNGTYSPQDAIRILLKGTPLKLRTDASSGAMVIAPPPTAPKSTAIDSSQTATPAQASSKSFWSRLRLAQADMPSPENQNVEHPAQSRERVELEEIVVAGSRLGGTQKESAQPVRLITRDQIERSGATSVPQVLDRLPEVAFSSTGNSTQGVPGSTTVRLRGLPSGSALVLINGRRIGSSSSEGTSGYFNLGNIPLAMVERIEVLPTGSSAVYGGDGLSGVVNLVLRRGFQGVEASVNHGRAEGYDETHASLAWGHSGSRGSLAIIGTYDTQSELTGAERAITSTMDFRPFGGTDFRLQTSNPGNVFSRTTQNLPGLNSTFAAVPAGSTGVGLTPAHFASTAGTLNRTSAFAANSSIYAPEERQAALLYGTLAVGSSTELFTELLFSHADVDAFSNYPTVQRALVPATNPFNPFGVDVLASFQLEEVGRSMVATSRDYLRALFGARGRLGSWSWEMAGWTSRDWQDEPLQNVLDSVAVNAALASTDPATALNVFQDGPGGSPQLLRSLLTSFESEYHGAMQTLSGTARGALLDLPAGPIEALIGAEYEDNQLEFLKGDALNGVDAGRESRSLFGEIRVPLSNLLTLSGAVRHDHYSDFGSRTSPGLGIEFRPGQSLLLRAAFGSSFKPPLLFHLYRPQRHATTTIFDPARGGETYLVPDSITGGNPALRPQTGQSRTFGLVFAPRSIPTLDFSLTHWALRLEDGAITPSVQYLMENESRNPDRIVRDASGRVVRLDRSFFNFGYIDEAGFDFTVNWRFDSAIGELTPSLSVTNTYHYEVQDAAGAPPRNAVGVVSAFGIGWAPRWKALASLGWQRGPVQATLQGRYVNEYRDGGPLADGSFKTLGNVWHVDANARFDLGSRFAAHRFLSGTRVSVGVVNLLDQLPEFSNVRAAWSYDPSQYDIRGRYAYLQLTVGF